MRKFYSLLLLILLSSCEKQDDLFSTSSVKNKSFSGDIRNSVWILQSIEYQNQKSYYGDTVEFLQDTILVYSGDTSSYEFYDTGKNTFQLRLKTSPVGYIDGDLNSVDLVSGRLNHHPFYNVFILSNKYYINMDRLR
jgi:hypothetical protein